MESVVVVVVLVQCILNESSLSRVRFANELRRRWLFWWWGKIVAIARLDADPKLVGEASSERLTELHEKLEEPFHNDVTADLGGFFKGGGVGERKYPSVYYFESWFSMVEKY